MKLTLKRERGKFNLTATNASGDQVFLDASYSIGCSAIDIPNILYKQKQSVETFEIDVDARRYTDRTPSVFENITLNIRVKGKVSENKLSRAISLTREKYCPEYHIFKHASTITYCYEIKK